MHPGLMVMEQQHNSANHAGDWKHPGSPRVLEATARPLKFYDTYGEKNHGEYFMLLVFRIAHRDPERLVADGPYFRVAEDQQVKSCR